MGCGASSSVAPVELSAARPPSSSNDESSDALQGSVSSQRRRTLTRRRPAISTETTSRLLDKRGSGAEVPALEKPEEVTTQLNKAMVGHPLFEHLSGKLLDRCIASMTEHKFNAGDLVIKHGDAGDQCYVVHSGAFEAFAEADRKKLEEFSAGGVFGELALLYNSPRACSVRATQDASTAYALDRDAFRLLVMMHTSGLKHGLQRYLASVPMLRDLEESQLASLADVMSCYDVVDGEYIVELGDTAECLFLVLSGEVVCHRKAADPAGGRGDDKELLRLCEGDFFGESCLNPKDEQRQRLANVVAVGPVRVGCLQAAACHQMIGDLTAAMSHNLNRKALTGVELLKSSLTPVEMEDVLHELQNISLEADRAVIDEGVVGTTFYIIKSGSVQVRTKKGGLIATLGPGDHFGERSLLTAEPTVASVVTAAPTQLMALDKATFERILPPLQDLVAREVAIRDMRARRKGQSKISWKDLKVLALLGEGSFGKVRLVYHKQKGAKTPFALKCLQKGQLIKFKQVEHVINEKNVLDQCCHPFILKLEATFNGVNQVYMLLEVALGGELFTHLRRVGKYLPSQACLYAAMVASAFAYLHARKIAHRDLKPENLLFDAEGYLKLVDFGFAKYIKDRTYTLCGTPEYLAPEIITNQGHNWGVDWWTLGILIYEMLIGSPPFTGETPLDTYKQIVRGKYMVPSAMPKRAKDITQRLLVHSAEGRLGCMSAGTKQALDHAFFEEISFKDLEARKLKTPYVPRIQDAFDTSNFETLIDDDSADQTWVPHNLPEFDQVWKEEFG